MRVIEPQQFGKFVVHIVGKGVDTQADRARCVSCRREMPFNCFAPYPFIPYEALARVKTAASLVLMAVCARCHEQRRNTDLSSHPMYTPEIDLYFKNLMGGLKSGASKRGLTVAITKDDIMSRYFHVKGRCEATGVVLKPFGARGLKNRLAPSVDRIDSAECYRADNIQIVSRVVNMMKSDMSMDVFATWCRRVASHHELREDSLLREIEGVADA